MQQRLRSLTALAVFPTLSLSVALAAANALAADYRYSAVADFPELEAGEVPYYRDTAHDALAINAANESYRDRFARATRVFDGESGLYDVTLTTLGELDGEGTYRLFLDDVLIGEVSNASTDTDYAEQTWVFDNIAIDTGMVIGVASTAVSNDLIPEGDGFAFARGRWRALTLVADAGSDPLDSVDLALTVTPQRADFDVASPLAITVEVANTGSVTATSPRLTLTLPDGLSLPGDSACTQDAADLVCTLPEIAADATASIAFEASASGAGFYEVTASVTADQTEAEPADNTLSLALTAIDPVIDTPDTTGDGSGGDTTGNTTDQDTAGSSGDSTDNTDNGGADTTTTEGSSGASGSGASGWFALIAMTALVRLRRRGVSRLR